MSHAKRSRPAGDGAARVNIAVTQGNSPGQGFNGGVAKVTHARTTLPTGDEMCVEVVARRGRVDARLQVDHRPEAWTARKRTVVDVFMIVTADGAVRVGLDGTDRLRRDLLDVTTVRLDEGMLTVALPIGREALGHLFVALGEALLAGVSS